MKTPWKMKIYLNPWHYWVVQEVCSGFSIRCYGTNFLANPTLWIFLILFPCFSWKVTTVFGCMFLFTHIPFCLVLFGALWKGYNTVHSPVKLAFLIQHFFSTIHSYGCYFSFLLLHSIPLSERSVTKLSILLSMDICTISMFFFSVESNAAMNINIAVCVYFSISGCNSCISPDLNEQHYHGWLEFCKINHIPISLELVSGDLTCSFGTYFPISSFSLMFCIEIFTVGKTATSSLHRLASYRRRSLLISPARDFG